MIRLNYNPIQGSALSVNLSFRDQQGKYYVPLMVTYTFLALNTDKETWSVVGDYYKKPLTPASIINLVIPSLDNVEGTTLQRKVIVNWKTTLDGAVTDFVDEINFEMQPMPTITNKPDEPIPPIVYVKVTSVTFQNGSPISSPVNPTIKLTINLPVNIENASVTFNDGENETAGSIEVDSSNSVLTVYPNVLLEYSKSYKMTVSGLVSTTGASIMEEPFEYNFTTMDAGSITLEELAEQIQEISENVSELDGLVRTLNDQVDSINGQIETINGQITSLDERVTALEG